MDESRSKRLLTAAAVVALMLHLGGRPVLAASVPGTFSGSDQSSACAGEADECSGLARSNIKARISWKVGPLVGEPVIDTRIAWKPDEVFGSVKHFVPPIYGESDPDLFYRPGEATAQLRLYEAKARLTVRYGNQTYTIDSDLGVLSPPTGVFSGFPRVKQSTWRGGRGRGRQNTRVEAVRFC